MKQLVQPNPNTLPPKHISQKEIQQIDQNKYVIESMTDKTKEYEVTIVDSGIGACSCPDFEYRRRQCKHIIKVLAYIFGVNN